MDVTQRLIEKDPTLHRHNEGRWNHPYDEYLPGYSSFNDAGIEIETGEFLYSMVRLLKPNNVLETGTHWGIGTAYMGQALKDNHNGHLDTVEFLPEIHKRALIRMNDLELTDYVECYLEDASKFIGELPESKTYKLILLDTEPQTRFAELVRVYRHLEPGGFVFIHDLHQHMHQVANEEHGFAWPYGVIPPELKKLVQEDSLRPFHFETPRGLTGFYKVDPKDYIWL